MATLKIQVHSKSKLAEWEGQLVANGQAVGLIKLGEDTVLDIPNGDVVLTVTAPKAKSNKLKLSGVQDGEIIEIKCEVLSTIFTDAAAISSGQLGCIATIIVVILGGIIDTLMPRRIKLSRIKES